MVETKENTRGLPAWIAIPLILAAIAGGSYWIWTLYKAQSARVSGVPLDPARADETGGRRGWGSGRSMFDFGSRNTRTPRGSIESFGSYHDVRIGGIAMRVDTRKGLDVYPRYSYPNQANPLATSDQFDLFMIGQTLIMDQRMRERVKLSSEQLEQLKKLGPRESMVGLTADERKRLTDLFKDWQAAGTDRAKADAAEKKLVASLDEIGKKHFDETKAAYAARAQKIQSILTPEQIQQYKAAAPPPPPPASRPSVAPGGRSGFGPGRSDPRGTTPLTRPVRNTVGSTLPATRPAAPSERSSAAVRPDVTLTTLPIKPATGPSTNPTTAPSK